MATRSRPLVYLITSGICHFCGVVENNQPLLYFHCEIHNYLVISFSSIHQGENVDFSVLGDILGVDNNDYIPVQMMQILLSISSAVPCSPSAQTLLSTQLPHCPLPFSPFHQGRERDVGCCGGGWEGRQIVSAAATLTQMVLCGKEVTSQGLSYLRSAP